MVYAIMNLYKRTVKVKTGSSFKETGCNRAFQYKNIF